MSNPIVTVHSSGSVSGTNRSGSFTLLSSAGKPLASEKNFPLGIGSDVEADFLALCSALDRLIVETLKRKVDLKSVRLKIITGSTPLWTKIQKDNSAPRPEDKLALRRWLYVNECWRRLSLFGGHEAKWSLDAAAAKV